MVTATLVDAQDQSYGTKPWLHQTKVATAQGDARAVKIFAVAMSESRSTKPWLQPKEIKETFDELAHPALASTSTKLWLRQNENLQRPPAFEIAPLK